jgi:D-xylose transport system substrate-binding protein
MRRFASFMIALCLAAVTGCAQGASDGQGSPAEGKASGNKKITIGFSMDTLKEERWQRDRDLVKKKIEALGGQLLVQAANSDDALQNSQAENLLTQGVDVLLVAPHNGRTAAAIVEAAHKLKVPVIAYDRLILDADVDLYISFDNVKVGELQAEYLVTRKPTGSYVLIGGAPTDNNALLLRHGQMNVLKPLVDKGDIKIVGDEWATDWKPAEALTITVGALTKNENQVDAVVASNDGIAGAAIQALGEQRLAGKVAVSGQDAELSACQRIVAGTQSMTVYKPIRSLADKAAEIAIKLAKKQPHGEVTRPINNGKKGVESILLAPVAVDKANIDSTVIADGYQRRDEVYKDAPKDQVQAAK